MYGNVNIYDYIPLTAENILLRVSQEDIFKLATGESPQIDRRYHSFFRRDDNGTCFYTWYNGTLYFVDFGYKRPHLDCFNAVEILKGLSFIDTLKYINSELKLGLDGENNPVQPKYAPLIKNKERKRKETEILFKRKPFTVEDKNFWMPYGISRKNLVDDLVVPLYWYKINSSKVKDYVVRPNTNCYAYTEFYPRLKIYTPYATRVAKWVSTTGKNDIGNINNLPLFGDLLVIQKSYKDARVLRNFGINTVWFQNEGMIPDSSIIAGLCRRFKKIIVWYDNDEPGIIAANTVSTYINSHFPELSETFHLDEELLKYGITDPSDLYKKRGRKELEILLIKNKLL